MKSMTLTYIPPREFRDDPSVTLALFSPSPSLTLLDYNFSRIPIKDVKGFEIITLLFASVFIDLLKRDKGDGSLASAEVKKETQRLKKLEEQEQEQLRREAEELERETERLRKLQKEEELAEKKKREEEVDKETARLRWKEGWYADRQYSHKTPSPTNKKKHWWSSGTGGQWSQRDVNGSQGYGPKYSNIAEKLIGNHV